MHAKVWGNLVNGEEVGHVGGNPMDTLGVKCTYNGCNYQFFTWVYLGNVDSDFFR